MTGANRIDNYPILTTLLEAAEALSSERRSLQTVEPPETEAERAVIKALNSLLEGVERKLSGKTIPLSPPPHPPPEINFHPRTGEHRRIRQ